MRIPLWVQIHNSSTFAKPSLIDSIARKTGWLKRKARAISPISFVKSLLVSVATGDCSMRAIAIEAGILSESGGTVSKQSIDERLNSSGVEFIKEIVGQALRASAASIAKSPLGRCIPNVSRILVGDSSTLTLHDSLINDFPGASNQHGTTSAQFRFQLTIDLLSGQWLQTELDPYRRNDRAAAMDIVKTIVKKGDLIIRDLGYHTIKSFSAIQDKSAYFLSRLSLSTKIIDLDGGEIDLLSFARKHAPRAGDCFSKEILLGGSKRFKCRIVVKRVPEEVAEQRRRRLNKDGQRKGFTHKKKHRQLQDWTFLVTSLGEDQASTDQLDELYRMRWRIENVFKLAKSHTKLRKIAKHRSNKYHVQILIWTWLLLMIGLSQSGMFRMLEESENRAEQIEHSVFKSIGRIIQWTALALEIAAIGSIEALLERLREQLDYHDRDEKRRRKSLPERLANVLNAEISPLLT